MNSEDVRRAWADRTGEFAPWYYAHHGPNRTSELLGTILDDHLDGDGPVLELGCSAGRHLAHLLVNGYDDLHGVEINGDAADVMADHYPALADRGTFHFEAIEDVVGEFEDDRFDAVFSVETLQHVHPDAEWVFDELGRITADLLVTAESDGPPERKCVGGDFPLYYREWDRVFADRGFVELDAREGKRYTVRTFRRESR